MGAQDRTEKVLRDIHVLFSKAEPYQGSKKNVIVDKTEVMDLLKELNACMYDMMDEHELSDRKKEKANREMKKQGDDIIFEATRNAEDIYAASIMYTDNALRQIQDIMQETTDAMDKLFKDTREQMASEQRTVKQNQSELKSQLEDLIDTQKYIHLIEDENRRLEAKKDGTAPSRSTPSAGSAAPAAPQPEIRINKAYFEAMGIPLEEEGTSASSSRKETEEAEELSEEEREQLSRELDEEYFDWKEAGDVATGERLEAEAEGAADTGRKVFSFFGKRNK